MRASPMLPALISVPVGRPTVVSASVTTVGAWTPGTTWRSAAAVSRTATVTTHPPGELQRTATYPPEVDPKRAMNITTLMPSPRCHARDEMVGR